MKRNGLIILILLVSLSGINGQAIKIGLFNHVIVESLAISCTGGEYLVLSGEEERILEIKKGDILFAALDEGGVRLYSAERAFGHFTSIEIRSLGLAGTFRVRPVVPALESRAYDDDLLIEGRDRYLNVINRVDIDKYIAGVLESEVGPNEHPELYKAHALLTRTYLLNHYDRHREEGFSLCDDVHCQAYHGRATYNQEIARSVYETSGEIVADYHYKLITAAYHSNSGGETQRAADVWLEDVDYLQAVLDPYSLHQPHSKWYDTISYNDWKNYLLEQGMTSVKKLPEELLYVQQRHRKKNFVLDKDTILMTKLREDWGWKSTFFNMFPEEDGKIVIWKGLWTRGRTQPGRSHEYGGTRDEL